MKLKENKKLLNELVKASSNPREFIESVMALQGQTADDVMAKFGTSRSHFYVMMHNFTKGHSVSPKTCVRLAKGLDIDPLILNRIITDYSMNKYLEANN